MNIDFKIDDATAVYSRSWFTGRATLSVDGQKLDLQDPLDPSTHISLRLSKSWTVPIHGHNVMIEKIRPLLAAGLRPQSYKISVDGQLLVERTGY